MKKILLVGCVALSLVACKTTTNSTGTPTTAAQQEVATLYGVYDAAVAGELAWLKSGVRNPATVKQFETYRAAAYSDLHSMMVQANAMQDTTAVQVSTQAAMDALTAYMTANGIQPANPAVAN